MNPKKRNTILTVLLLAGTVVMFVFIIRRSLSFEAPQKNLMLEFNKELDSLALVDTSSIGYVEMDSIALDFKNATSIHIDTKNQLFVTADSTLYLLDTLGRQIQSAHLSAPVQAVSAHENGTIYVAAVNRIVVVDSVWSNIVSMPIGDTNTFLASLTVEGVNVFAGDVGKRTIWHLDTAGKVLGRIGDREISRNIPGLVIPNGSMDIVIGRDNSLWVINSGNHRVENYRFNGDLITSWGASGAEIERFAGCCGPVHMTLLPDGCFVTSEKGFSRVKVYDQAGRFLTVVAPPASFKGPKAGLSLAADSHGTIYVLDTYENTIRKFKKKNA